MATENVVNFFKGKNIFITGGTGFVGVCLIEKILRCIPDVGKIYLLMRPKKDKEIQERLQDIQKNSVFDRITEDMSKEQLEKSFSKLHAIAGDVGQPKLGISDSDRALLVKEVNVVFHSAATLDFEATLKPTVEINLLGTRRVMELCTEMKNLESVVHVSSAYVNSFKLQTEEIVYPYFMPAKEVIELVEKYSEPELDDMTTNVLNGHPNTYTFTKHLAEHEVVECQEKFPCAIVRPSMITGAWKEPMPGWTISKNGPQGFLMGASKGVIRRLPVAADLVYDYIPVDIVINELIAAAFYVGLTKPKKVQVYHCTTSTRKPFKWNYVDTRINDYLHKYPLKSAVWYPHLKLISSITWFRISAFFVHILPAIFLDTVTKLSGGRPILMKLHRNVNNSLNRLQKFIFTEWMFAADRSEELNTWLKIEDRKIFGLSVNNLDWRDYFISLTQGVRRYLSKEHPKNLELAKSKDKILLIVHLVFQAILYFLIWFGVASIIGTTLSKTIITIPIIYFLFNLL